jgi:hypothetical protein
VAKKGYLTGKQRAFVDAWLANGFHGTEAARAAGYGGGERALGAAASRNLANPKIRAAIERRWAVHGMNPEEVTARWVEQARGSMADFLQFRDGFSRLDLDAAREAGKLHLIKSIAWTKEGVKIELYSAKDALDSIARSLGMFKDKLDIASGGNPVGVSIVEVVKDYGSTDKS